MAAEVGWAGLGIIPTFDKFGSELERGTGKAMTAAGVQSGHTFGDSAGKSAGRRFGGVFKTAAKASLVGIAGLGAVAFKVGADSVALASDLNETVSKTAQIFGKQAMPALEKYGDAAAQNLGQSKQSALDAVATFGVMGKVAGLQGPKLAKFSTKLTGLASDLASFGNTSPEEAIEAIGSALRGEAEPIRKYGVLLDEASLKAEALSLGILKPVKDEAKIKSYQARVLEGQKKYNDAVAEFGPKSIEAIKAQAALGTAQSGLEKATEGSIPTLTSQQKVLAAQSAILKQTGDAQGDFARTSDGLANQQRILSARLDDAKAKLGTGLLPIVTDAVTFLNDKGVPAFVKFSDWFTDKGIPAISNFADDMRPLAKSLLPAAGDALGIIADGAKKAAPFARDMVDAFADMPDWAKTAIVGGGAGLFAGKKLGLLGGGKNSPGGSKGLLGLVTKAKPMPVFVVNNMGPGGVPGKPGTQPVPGVRPRGVGKTGAILAALAGGTAAALAADGPGSGAAAGAAAGASGWRVGWPKGHGGRRGDWWDRWGGHGRLQGADERSRHAQEGSGIPRQREGPRHDGRPARDERGDGEVRRHDGPAQELVRRVSGEAGPAASLDDQPLRAHAAPVEGSNPRL